MAPLKRERQEKFCQFIFQGYNQREAYVKAGYSCANLAIVDSHASHLATTSKVEARISELRQRAEDKSVMSVIERKQRLSEAGRADLADFIDPGGETLHFDKQHPNHRAVIEYSVSTTYTKHGDPIVTQ